MSKRGNPDYWKTAGVKAEDPDIDEAAKQRFGVSRRVWMRGEQGLRRPRPPQARRIEPLPIREGQAPWRVVHREAAVAERSLGEEPVARPGLVRRSANLALRLALSPVRFGLSLAESLVERAWGQDPPRQRHETIVRN